MKAGAENKSRASEERSDERVEGWFDTEIMWYLYIAECQDKALYTGITENLERRLKEHQAGKGGHYTNYNRPSKLLYRESFENKIDAEKREQQIKGWSRAKKWALVNGDKINLRVLSKSRD